MNIIENKKIAIIGGGPGGLTLARLLQMNGANVIIYERDEHKDARAKGATLDLHEESGLKALKQAGLIAAFNANYRPGADRLRITDKHGNILVDEHESRGNDRSRPEIDRGPLLRILLESLNQETINWNCQFTALTPYHTGWDILFKNGSHAFADIVVAADGANSKLRSYITPIKPFYSGVTAIEGAVYNSEIESPRMHDLLKGGKIFAMGDEKSLIVSSKGDGSLMFYTSFNTGEFWINNCDIDFSDKTKVLDWFKKEYSGWAPLWQELFENSSGAFICRPLYCMPLDQTWTTHTNLTMLGDAAHLMPPFAGEGVNMAMLDALELANVLLSDNFPDSLQAIAYYEDQMRKRASQTAQDSLDATAALHSENAISFLLNTIGQDQK